MINGAIFIFASDFTYSGIENKNKLLFKIFSQIHLFYYNGERPCG